MKRKKAQRDNPAALIPETPRPIPDVEIPPTDPDLWGGEGGGGAYPGGPTGKKKPKSDRE